jgi:hypothetical protein
MRHRFSTTSLVTVATAALGYWSTASAGSSFKIVTAPSGTGQVQSNADSSFKIVAAPQLSQAAVNGSSLNESDADERQVNSKVTLPRRAVQLVRLPSNTQREVSFDEPYAVVNTSNKGSLTLFRSLITPFSCGRSKRATPIFFSTILRASS